LAVYAIESPAFSVAVDGAMLNVTGCDVMETLADAEAEGLVVVVAVTTAVSSCEIEEGAV